MAAGRHPVSRGRSAHIKTILRQTFANDVAIGDHADQPVILANRDSADVVCAHQFGEFGDRGIWTDPLNALVHCLIDFHADLLLELDAPRSPPWPQVLNPIFLFPTSSHVHLPAHDHLTLLVPAAVCPRVYSYPPVLVVLASLRGSASHSHASNIRPRVCAVPFLAT